MFSRGTGSQEARPGWLALFLPSLSSPTFSPSLFLSFSSFSPPPPGAPAVGTRRYAYRARARERLSLPFSLDSAVMPTSPHLRSSRQLADFRMHVFLLRAQFIISIAENWLVGMRGASRRRRRAARAQVLYVHISTAIIRINTFCRGCFIIARVVNIFLRFSYCKARSAGQFLTCPLWRAKKDRSE